VGVEEGRDREDGGGLPGLVQAREQGWQEAAPRESSGAVDSIGRSVRALATVAMRGGALSGATQRRERRRGESFASLLCLADLRFFGVDDLGRPG
jgi:hypothetical protein